MRWHFCSGCARKTETDSVRRLRWQRRQFSTLAYPRTSDQELDGAIGAILKGLENDVRTCIPKRLRFHRRVRCRRDPDSWTSALQTLKQAQPRVFLLQIACQGRNCRDHPVRGVDRQHADALGIAGVAVHCRQSQRQPTIDRERIEVYTEGAHPAALQPLAERGTEPAQSEDHHLDPFGLPTAASVGRLSRRVSALEYAQIRLDPLK